MTTDEVRTVDTGARTVSRQVVVNAPADQLFAMLADPRRHGEVDGSGTVRNTVSGPDRLSQDAKFSVNMKMFGFPYRVTSKVTAFEDGRLIEWRHPLGHRWRWRFEELEAGRTEVTETFDYRGAVFPAGLELVKAPPANAKSIRDTLTALRDRFV